jgi:RHS repeat-associated protein
MRYLGKDLLGSVRSVTVETGTLEDRYEYDAFGTPYQGDLAKGMNLGYTGKPYDTATGLYNYGYRDYRPETARFTTLDPIRDGNNWFAYVNNDPVNYVDLWGLEGKVTNSSSHTALVKPEDPISKSDVFIPLLPGEEHNGNIDGVLTHDGNIYKGNSGSDVTITNNNPPFETTKTTDDWNNFWNALKDFLNDERERYGIYTDYGKGYPGLENWWSTAIKEEGQPTEWGKSNNKNGGCDD